MYDVRLVGRTRRLNIRTWLTKQELSLELRYFLSECSAPQIYVALDMVPQIDGLKSGLDANTRCRKLD